MQASQLRRFAVYFDVGKPLWQPKKAWKDMLAYDWDQLFKTGIAADTARAASGSTSPREPSGAADRMYVVKPIDGQLQYLRRGKNVRGGRLRPSRRLTATCRPLPSMCQVSPEQSYNAGHANRHIAGVRATANSMFAYVVALS